MKKVHTDKNTEHGTDNAAEAATPSPPAPAEPPQGTENASAPETAAEEERLDAEQIEKLKAEAAKAAEYWDRLLRLQAEFDNFRKRAARDKEEAVRYANHKLLERLLPVLDSFDMALAAAQTQNGNAQESLKEGIAMVRQQLKTALAEAGLEEIEAHGQPFDPNLHEAVSQVESHDVEDGHVAHEIRKGYRLRDRLVRASSVVVAKKPSN